MDDYYAECRDKVKNSTAQDRAIKFKQIRQQLDATLNYMEQIIVAEKEFPSTFQEDGRWW